MYRNKYLENRSDYIQLQNYRNTLIGGNDNTDVYLQNIDIQLTQYKANKILNISINNHLEFINRFYYNVNDCLVDPINKDICNREKFIRKILIEKIENAKDIMTAAALTNNWSIVYIICKYFMELMATNDDLIMTIFSFLPQKITV